MSRWPPRIGGPGGTGPIPPVGGDHFAPTIIVGNVPAGDPAGANPAPFQYVGDTGNGAGIAAAFTAAGAAGGWVHIRRGLYDFGAVGAPPLPLALVGFRVTGEGCATRLRMSTLDRRLFVLITVGLNGPAPELAHVGIDWTVAAVGAVGTECVEAATSSRALIESVDVVKNLGGATIDPTLNPNESLTSIFRGGIETRFVRSVVRDVDGTAGLAVVAFRLAGARGTAHLCSVSGANVGFRTEALDVAVRGAVSAGGVIAASHTGVELAGLRNRLEGAAVDSAVDGIVALPGGSAIVTGCSVSGLTGDGIRVDLGATGVIVTSNQLNGTSLVALDPTAEVAHNVL